MKLRALLIILCSLVSTSNSASSRELSVVTEPLPPLQIQERDGSAAGAAVEIVELLLKEANISDSEIAIQPWVRSYKQAIAEPNTLIFSIARTPDREQKFHWLAKLYQVDTYLAKLKSHKHLNVEQLDDALNYRLAIIRQDFTVDDLRQRGFSDKKHLFTTSTRENLWRQLFRGRVDFVVTSTLIWHEQITELGYDPNKLELHYKIPGQGRDLYLAASLNTSPTIMTRLQKAFAVIKQDGRYQQILAKWHL